MKTAQDDTRHITKLNVHTDITTWRHYLILDGKFDETLSSDNLEVIRRTGDTLVQAGLAEWA